MDNRTHRIEMCKTDPTTGEEYLIMSDTVQTNEIKSWILKFVQNLHLEVDVDNVTISDINDDTKYILATIYGTKDGDEFYSYYHIYVDREREYTYALFQVPPFYVWLTQFSPYIFTMPPDYDAIALAKTYLRSFYHLNNDIAIDATIREDRRYCNLTLEISDVNGCFVPIDFKLIRIAEPFDPEEE